MTLSYLLKTLSEIYNSTNSLEDYQQLAEKVDKFIKAMEVL